MSSPLPQNRWGKVEQPNLSTPAKTMEKKKAMKNKTSSPSPVYVPSKYELKATQRRREIAKYMEKFPKEKKEVKY